MIRVVKYSLRRSDIWFFGVGIGQVMIGAGGGGISISLHCWKRTYCMHIIVKERAHPWYLRLPWWDKFVR